ncbi:MAG: hypothetical protein QM324_01640 [Bacteroidota bacterium]|nr:hypothetical protein [Bacteroidota bacterium]
MPGIIRSGIEMSFRQQVQLTLTLSTSTILAQLASVQEVVDPGSRMLRNVAFAETVFVTPISQAGIADRTTPWKALQAVSVFATLVSQAGVADRRTPWKALQAGPVFVTPILQAGVADRRTPWKALHAGSVFATPISLPGVADR